MDSFFNINFLIACQLFAGVIPGFCRSPILHLGEMGELGWEEHRVVSNHSQSPASHSHDFVDVDCKANEDHRVRRASVWIENDYFNVDEEDEPDLREDPPEVFSSFLRNSTFFLQKSLVGCRGGTCAPQTAFSGAECVTQGENILDFIEGRDYDLYETAAGA
ncbi:MAG: hypothetical protein ACRCUQ_00875 [Alphaproteobacteria bacterium]